MKRYLSVLVLAFIALSAFSVAYCSGEFDAITVVSWVTDGDTFDITTEETVRFADIDAPEYYEKGGNAATNYLNTTIYNKTVYLDIDDIYTYDEKNGEKGEGDRLVCVVYIEYNQTHYLNVNKALLVAGHAEIDDFDNEFNPNNWSLYVLKEEIPELSSIMLITSFIIATISIIFVSRR